MFGEGTSAARSVKMESYSVSTLAAIVRLNLSLHAAIPKIFIPEQRQRAFSAGHLVGRPAFVAVLSSIGRFR